MLKKIILAFVILLFTANLFAQKAKSPKPKTKVPASVNFQVGNLPNPKAPAADFLKQKNITVAKGFTFVTCAVYFAGAGFPSVQVATMNGSSMSQIQSLVEICRPGSSIVFANIKIKGPDGVRTIDDVYYALY